MKPLVTISIPLFKCEDFIETCLQSVLAQTYTNLEVTLINDCTPDRSVQIAERFIEKYRLQDTWQILHLTENSGLSVVRNKGIDTARGKYLFFLDSDDTITPGCIEKLVDLAEKEQVQMTIGYVNGIRLESGEKFDVFPVKLSKDVLRNNRDIFEIFIEGGIPVHSWNKLIRTDFLRNHKLYFVKGLFAQDSLHTFHMMLKLESIAVFRKKTYHYYLHKKSVIHNRNKRNFDNWQTIAEYIHRSMKEESDPYRKQKILQYLINYKTTTLLMNWKAQKNPDLWKESYRNYQKLDALKLGDYLGRRFSKDIKKKSLLLSLPVTLGYWLFRKRFDG